MRFSGLWRFFSSVLPYREVQAWTFQTHSWVWRTFFTRPEFTQIRNDFKGNKNKSKAKECRTTSLIGGFVRSLSDSSSGRHFYDPNSKEKTIFMSFFSACFSLLLLNTLLFVHNNCSNLPFFAQNFSTINSIFTSPVFCYYFFYISFICISLFLLNISQINFKKKNVKWINQFRFACQESEKASEAQNGDSWKEPNRYRILANFVIECNSTMNQLNFNNRSTVESNRNAKKTNYLNNWIKIDNSKQKTLANNNILR